MVYNTLNRIKWAKRLGGCEIKIIHRGAEGNVKTIQGISITEIKKSYFCCRQNATETFIPMHRILEVMLDGKVVWKRKEKKALGS